MKLNKRLRSTVVCVRDENFLAIELKDPTTNKRMWSLPGGQIESGESAEDAAIRETFEETGYQVDLLSNPKVFTTYIFRWNAKIYDCSTHWFAARVSHSDEEALVDDADYLLGHRWLPISRINELFSYHPHVRDITLEFAKEVLVPE